MKFLSGLLLALVSACALAQASTFGTTIGTAILCLDDLQPAYFYRYMTETKRSYKHDQGAYWFKASADLFGVTVTEVFVSDGSSRDVFVGALTSLPPDQVADTLNQQALAGAGFKKDNPKDRYSGSTSRSGSVSVFQGRNGKIFCRRDRVIDN